MSQTTDKPGTDLAPVVAGETSLLNFVAQAVSDPNVDVAKLEALLRMQREIVADDARGQFNRALHAAQQAMPRVKKNGAIDLGKGKPIPFTKWSDMHAALRPIMRDHGFSLSFSATSRADGTGAVVSARLLHCAGHAQDFTMPLPPDVGPGRNALQAMGSTLSYAKRYLAEMAFNIVREDEDDDGDRGGATFITPEQKEQIIALMQETGADTKRFLEHFNIAVLDDLREQDFAQAMNALARKRGRGAAP